MECLKVCLQCGADSEVRNYKSETPQQLAYLCNSDAMVKLCQDFGSGSYQLEYAETESVNINSDSDDSDCEFNLLDDLARGVEEINMLTGK